MTTGRRIIRILSLCAAVVWLAQLITAPANANAQQYGGQQRTRTFTMTQAPSGASGHFFAFDGISDTGNIPPEPGLAVSEFQVMQVVSGWYRISTKCGDMVAEGSYADLFGDYTATLYNPRVAYDPWERQFVLAVASITDSPFTSQVYFAAFEENYPAPGTTVHKGELSWRLDGAVLTNNYAADINFSVGPEAYYVTSDQWDHTSPVFQYAKIRVIDKAWLIGGGGVPYTDFTNLTNPSDGSLASAIRPARMNSWEGTQWLINSKAQGDSIYTIWSIWGTVASPSLASSGLTHYAPYELPPDARQPDSTLVDFGDCRISDAAYAADTLWAAHGERAWGQPDRCGVRYLFIDTATPAIAGGWRWQYIPGNMGFAGLDFDKDRKGWGSIALLDSAGYLSIVGHDIGHTYLSTEWETLAYGQANYSNFASEPYWWGGTFPVVRDRTDDMMLWYTGAFASNSPVPSWDTKIGVTSFGVTGVLEVSYPPSQIITGPPGGPFSPYSISYILSNFGETAVTWSLGGLDAWSWASVPESTLFTLSPFDVDTVLVGLAGPAFALPPGAYEDEYGFFDCIQGGTHIGYTYLGVSGEPHCPGAEVAVTLTDGVDKSTASFQAPGIFVSILKDFEICAIGMRNDLVIPQMVTARVYEADGLTRGALIAEDSAVATSMNDTVSYVPIDVFLQACRDYVVSFEFTWSDEWVYWDASTTAPPFDTGDLFRTRMGEMNGVVANEIPELWVIGNSVDCEADSDLGPPGATWTSINDASADRGMHIVPHRALNVCAVGWEADVLSPPAELTARIYVVGVGGLRSYELARGTLPVGTSGKQMHWIPVSAVLEEGHEYDIAVEFPDSVLWSLVWEDSISLPYLAEDVMWIRNGEANGDTSNVVLGHFGLQFKPHIAGEPFDLRAPGGPHPPPNTTSLDSDDQGIFVKSLIGQQLYAVSWLADIPEGHGFTMRVWESPDGVTLGNGIMFSSVISGTSGMRWHQCPAWIDMKAGSYYNVNFNYQNTNEWRYWTSATPFQVNGVIEVVSGESGGSQDNALMELQFYMCDNVMTDVAPDPMLPPPFYVSDPYPNPAARHSRLDYSLDAPGEVTIAIYDVAGRKVTTVLSKQKRPAGPGSVEFNTRDLVAGIYFIRMESGSKHMSRKIAVVR